MNLVTVTYEIISPPLHLWLLYSRSAHEGGAARCYFVPKTLETIVEGYCADLLCSYFYAALSAWFFLPQPSPQNSLKLEIQIFLLISRKSYKLPYWWILIYRLHVFLHVKCKNDTTSYLVKAQNVGKTAWARVHGIWLKELLTRSILLLNSQRRHWNKVGTFWEGLISF